MTNQLVTIIDTENYEVHVRNSGYISRASRPTVYVTAPDPDMEHPGYGSVRDDESEQDKAWKKYNRAEIKMQRGVIDAIIPLLADLRTDDLSDADKALVTQTVTALTGKLGFSRKAGCGCGCSPGFKAQALQPSYQGIDIWVEDKSVERDRLAAQQADEEAARGYDIDQLDDVDLLSYYA